MIKKIILFVLIPIFCKSQIFPTGFSQQLVTSGLVSPTAMAFAPDGRIFITLQGGKIRVIKNGALLPAPFATLSVDSAGERGLLGIALDPMFSANNYVYVYYTLASGANNRISRFTANGDVAAGGETVILNLDPIGTAEYHNGGCLQFGTDGKLYVGVGDNTNGANAQDLDTYHGKVLRINADGSVPAGNPFTTGSNQQRRVWSFGLRNPYTIGIDKTTDKIFANDVGQNSWEEINDCSTGGLNYGWPTAEGNSGNPAFTNPVYAYPHGGGTGNGCAITGGTFFAPVRTNYPNSYIGKYFFIDLCNNWIDKLKFSSGVWTRTNFATNLPGGPVDIRTGNDGNLYYLSYNTSSLYRIIFNSAVIRLISVADAHVKSGNNAQVNYGNDKLLYVKNTSSSSSYSEAFLRFDISGISPGISSAILKLYGAVSNSNNPSITVQAFNVTSQTWQEKTLTFSNKPSAQTTVLASANVSGTAKKYYNFNVTQHINNLLISGNNFVSFQIKGLTVTNNSNVIFNSQEANANKPQLLITQGPAPEKNFDAENSEPELLVRSEAINLFPVPANNWFNVSSNRDLSGCLIRIYNLHASLVKEIQIMNQKAEKINIEELEPGIYFVRISGNDFELNQKLLIAR